MSAVSVVQFVGSLGRNRGGLTKSLYERSMLLGKAHKVIFVNISQQRDADEIFSELKSERRIPVDTELVNFYSEIAVHGSVGTAPQSQLTDIINRGAMCTEELSGAGSIRRYFVDGVFMGLRASAKDGRVLRDEYYDPNAPWKVTHRDHYDRFGGIWKREYLAENFRPRYQVLYNDRGGAYFASWISENRTPYRVSLFDGHKATQYADVVSAAAPWLSEYISSLGECVLVSDEPQTLPCLYLPKYNRDKVKTVAAIHTTHYKNHMDPSGGFKGWFPQYLQNRSSINRYIFFTDSQKRDFLSDASAADISASVIPHFAPDGASGKTLRDPNLVVTVSRLDKGKRIGDAIIAFSKVANSFPDVRYDIYGSGPEGSDLIALVEKLGLAERIKFKGYTNDPLAVFQSASLNLITTLYEGFGLTLLESMSSGCPVIAYDVKYGPTEIVQNDKSGLLVASGKVSHLAVALERVLSNRDLLARLGAGATRRAAEFSIDKWRTGWMHAVFKW